MTGPEKDCGACSTTRSDAKKTSASLLSGFLIAIIPKCPWCVLAYGSAAGFCGTSGQEFLLNSWALFIAAALMLTTIGLIFYNYKGLKSWMAVGIVLLGGWIIVGAESNNYPYGVAVLMIGVWTNGSLMYFWREGKRLIQNFHF